MKTKISKKTMKWIEIIELRYSGKDCELLKSQLRKLTIDIEKNTKEISIRIFRRPSLDTDFSIHLFHDSEKVDDFGSTIGLHIASNLKEYGLVNHEVWIE